MQVLIYSHSIMKVTTTPVYSLSRQRIRFHASVIIFTPAYSLSRQRIHTNVFTVTPAYSLSRQCIYLHASVFTYTPVLLILLPAILIIFIRGTNKSNLVINSLCGETVRYNRLNNCIIDFLCVDHSKSSVDRLFATITTSLANEDYFNHLYI